MVKRRFVKELNSSLRDSDRPVIVKGEIGKNVQLVNVAPKNVQLVNLEGKITQLVNF